MRVELLLLTLLLLQGENDRRCGGCVGALLLCCYLWERVLAAEFQEEGVESGAIKNDELLRRKSGKDKKKGG